MRPRQSSLGIAGSGGSATRETRGFNEAEAIKPRNPQREHRQVADHPHASMRPRQSSLGIARPRLHGGNQVSASMRPRQSSLGILTEIRKWAANPPLQ